MPTIDEIYTLLAEIREELKLIKDEQKRLAIPKPEILTLKKYKTWQKTAVSKNLQT